MTPQDIIDQHSKEAGNLLLELYGLNKRHKEIEKRLGEIAMIQATVKALMEGEDEESS